MRTTIVLPDGLKKDAQRVAAERGVSMSELIREALHEKLDKSRRRLRFIGIVSIGEDLGRRSGEEPAIPEPWR